MDEISLLDHTTVRVYFENKDTYKFDSSKKYLWLQKVCIKILAKLGCHGESFHEIVKTHVINKSNLIEKLNEANRLICSKNKTPTTLLIGPEEFAELMQQDPIHNLLKFDIKYPCMENKNGVTDRYMMGMRVVIVPWMKGILPLTKDILE